MSGYVKWDRAAYRQRIGEAERRCKLLMARQSGHQLAEERKRHGPDPGPASRGHGRVSQVERGEVALMR